MRYVRQFEFLHTQRSLSSHWQKLFLFLLKKKNNVQREICNVNNPNQVFFLPDLRCKRKAIQSFGAYPAFCCTGSFSLPGSLTGCQTLQATYWWGDKHWPTLIKLLVWLFPILYCNSIYTHTQDTDAYLDQSVLVTSPHFCQHVASTEGSASRSEQQWWVKAVFICMSISCEVSRKG